MNFLSFLLYQVAFINLNLGYSFQSKFESISIYPRRNSLKMSSLNFNPARVAKKLISMPAFIAVEGTRALRDGFYYASDVAETLPDVTKSLPDVTKTLPELARTLPELPTKVEETKSIISGKIMRASAAVLNIPSSLNNFKENISQKGRSKMRSLSPGIYFNQISSTLRNNILSFYEFDEKSKEKEILRFD